MNNTLNWIRSNAIGLFTPAVLALVASIHVIVSISGVQSPWKGGGFGMFSTIVSPASRVVKAKLITDEGAISIQIPKEFSKQDGRIRTHPSQAAVDELARSLADAAWAPVSMTPIGYQYDALSKRVPSDDGTVADLNDMLTRMKMVRILAQDEPRDAAIVVTGVEVVCYQVEFDAKGKRLWLRMLVQSSLDLKKNDRNGK